MKAAPQPLIFVVEGDDVGIFESVEHAQNHLEPVDVKDGIYEGYDGLGRLLRITTDGRDTFIELAQDEPSDITALETTLRTYLVHVGEKRAAQAGCNLPCLVEISGRHAELDRRALARAARELKERYRSSFEKRGGDLRVRVSTSRDIGTRTTSIELYAGVEWEDSRIYDHAHVEVVRRPWFSRRWERLRSLREAVDELDARLAEWLTEAT